MKYHSQSHWLNWKWMSSVTNLLPPYLFLDFQFPAQEKSGSFPYKAHWIHWIPRDSIDPRKTVDSQPQYVVVRKIHTPRNGLLVLFIIIISSIIIIVANVNEQKFQWNLPVKCKLIYSAFSRVWSSMLRLNHCNFYRTMVAVFCG